MSDDDAETAAPTRREYLTYGGAVVGGGLLAGCTGDGGGSGATTPTSTPTGAETTAEPTDAQSETPTETTTEATGYSVTMSPMGTVEFDSVPERAVSFDDQWVDHMIALGQGEKLVGLARPDGYFTAFYDQLPGVSFDTSDVTAIWSEDAVDMEILFELDADVHHIDPLRAVDTLDGLDEANVESVEREIGPFFANRGSRANNVPGGVDVDYEFYTLWEILSKFAAVYQVQDRSAALKSVRDEMVSEIQSNLPPESDRPSVALAQFWNGEFYVYKPNKPGFGSAHLRPLQLKDALPDVDGYASSNWQASPISVEAMLEADPDVYIAHNAVGNAEYYRTKSWPKLREDPVASQITAVKNDRLHIGGTGLHGPLFNLFQIEMTAKQVYPDRFGEYPGVGESVPEAERLFDRQRVSEIVNGNL
jgi:ABC-type Fe3+-hydroxamate transport system substrate-binding protein